MTEQELFPASNGQATGVGGLVVSGAVAVVALTLVPARYGIPLFAIAVLLAVLTYAVVLRPRVGLAGDDLLLRQAFGSTLIPLAAVQDLTVRRVAVFRVAGKKYDTPALARSAFRPRRGPKGPATTPAPEAWKHIEHRITTAMARARVEAGVAEWSEEQAALAVGIRRVWSWPLIALTLLALAAVVAALTA